VTGGIEELFMQGSGSMEDERRIRFRPLAEALSSTPEEPAWVVPGMVAKGLVTVLAGKPKVGKSTFAFGMVKAIARRESFLGDEAVRAKTLLLTEERELTLNEKWNVFGLAEDDGTHVLMRYEADDDWPRIVEQAVQYCTDHELEVLVVDGWDKWSSVKDENDAVAVNRALEPLLVAAAKGLAVVIIAHQRKGKGEHGDAVRGSNAFIGAADVILELQRAGGEFGEQGGRVLYGNSRLMSTPEKLALNWNAETGVYTAGDLDEIEYVADKDRVSDVLDTEGQKWEEIADKVDGMRRDRLKGLLAELVDDGVAFRTGEGKKNNAYRWRLRTLEDDDQESGGGSPELEKNAGPATNSGLEAGSGFLAQPCGFKPLLIPVRLSADRNGTGRDEPLPGMRRGLRFHRCLRPPPCRCTHLHVSARSSAPPAGRGRPPLPGRAGDDGERDGA
jgi:hypothetical protein